MQFPAAEQHAARALYQNNARSAAHCLDRPFPTNHRQNDAITGLRRRFRRASAAPVKPLEMTWGDVGVFLERSQREQAAGVLLAGRRGRAEGEVRWR